jgi:hypothetical protein
MEFSPGRSKVYARLGQSTLFYGFSALFLYRIRTPAPSVPTRMFQASISFFGETLKKIPLTGDIK